MSFRFFTPFPPKQKIPDDAYESSFILAMYVHCIFQLCCLFFLGGGGGEERT